MDQYTMIRLATIYVVARGYQLNEFTIEEATELLNEIQLGGK